MGEAQGGVSQEGLSEAVRRGNIGAHIEARRKGYLMGGTLQTCSKARVGS